MKLTYKTLEQLQVILTCTQTQQAMASTYTLPGFMHV